MASRSCIQQSPSNNHLANLTGEQDELISFQGPAKRLDANSNKASILLETSIPLFVFPTKDFFTKLIKAFVELTQA